MTNILITGATGNTGIEVVRYLSQNGFEGRIIAGVRDMAKAKKIFEAYPKLEYVHFDFEDAETFNSALKGIDRIFLLRPPHISDVDKYFRPLMASIKEENIKGIAFLSVQGAERSKIIPHHKIESLIKESDIDYIFLRPGYFMQNLTTTLINDIKGKGEIVLPSGMAKFNWVDIEDIGEVMAVLLKNFEEYRNQAYEITGPESENFERVTALINEVVKNPIRYRNVNPLQFFIIKKKEGMVTGMIVVMIMLHFLPRLQKNPPLSDFYERITGKKPTGLKSFIYRERNKFE